MVDKDEIIIVFDSNISKEYLEWLKKNYIKNRIIFWYWNPVHTTLQPDQIPKGIEKWSYSLSDCKKYKLKYNTTFFFDIYNRDTQKIKLKQKKAIFIGRDKGRLDKLLYLKNELEKQGIICEIHIIGNPKKIIDGLNQYYEKIMTYDKVIDLIKKSDFIIDIYTDIYAGLSLRPMEAIFFNKILITNSKLIKEYDFFDSKLIYIIGDNKITLSNFLKNCVEDRQYMNVNYYTINSWYKRFSEGMK